MSDDSLLRFADTLTESAALTKAAPPAPEILLVTFFIDEAELAVPILRVVEILRVGELARVPGAPPQIRGITNVRGRILPVVELRARLLLPPATITPRFRILLVEAHGRVLGLLVDAVAEVLKVPVSAVVPPPDELRSLATDYIQAIARQGDRMIVLIDLDRAILLPTRPEPSAAEETE